MTVDEIDSGRGDARGPLGRSRLIWLAIGAAVAGGLVWWLVAQGGPSEPAAIVSPTPSASQSPGTPQRPGIADAELSLSEVCTPTTDGRRSLTVSFAMDNDSPAELVVMSVVPQLPLGGLTLDRVRVTGGTCSAPSGVLVGGRVPAGGSAHMVMRFALPAECPTALPVAALVTTRVFNVNRSGQQTRVPLLPDLGSLEFDSCA